MEMKKENEVGGKWEVVKLGDLVSILSGFAFDSKLFNDKHGMPLIRIRDIIRGYSETFYNGDFENRYIVKQGDLLVGMDGEFNLSKWTGEDSLLNQRVCKIEVNNTKVLDPNYLKYFLPLQLKLIEDKASFVTVKHLSVKDINNILIPLPPLDTQQRIAAILDAADALRRKDQELLRKYDELAQAIFIDMFGDPVKNEKGWEVKKLGEVCERITDGTHFSPKNTIQGYPYITAKHVRPNLIDFDSNPTYISAKDHDEIYSRCNPKKGDVLYIKDGATTGISAVNEFDYEFSMLSSLALIRPNESILNSYYLCFYLNNEIVKSDLILKYMSGAAIKRFTLDKINKFQISIPPKKLQDDFQRRWFSIRELNSINSMAHSKILFYSLLQQAFSGELVA